MRALASLFCATVSVLFTQSLVPSTPEQIASFHSDQTIGNVVSPISGQPGISKKDVTAVGAQSIDIIRHYLPPTIPMQKGDDSELYKFNIGEHLQQYYKGWTTFPHLHVEYFPENNTVRIPNRSGITLDFQLFPPNFKKNTLITPSQGLTNTHGDVPSGKYDLRNTKIVCDKARGTIVVSDPDGSVRHYTAGKAISPQKSIFLLVKERLPSGKILSYKYQKRSLVQVEAKDPSEKHTYASIKIENSTVYTTSSNQKGIYQYHRPECDVAFNHNPYTGQKLKEYKHALILPRVLKEISTATFANETCHYQNDFLLSGYTGENDSFKCTYAPVNGRYLVEKVTLPENQVYALKYSPGKTTVTRPDGIQVEYLYANARLLTSIRWLENNTLRKETCYTWDKARRLASLEIKDGKGKTHQKTSYTYDDFGNPITETNLAGHTITRIFSSDGKNLLLREENDGKITTWEYLKGTNLVTKETVCDGKKPLSRKTYKYDTSHNLIEESIEDLAGTKAKITTRYHLRKTAPFLHMPEVIEVRDGNETLIKKAELSYDKYGNVASEKVFGSDGRHAYTIEKKYDTKGNLLSETDRLGNKASYTYDLHNRLVSKTNSSGRLTTTYTYDKKGRVTAKHEKSREQERKYTYKYDGKDRLVEEIDHFGQKKTYLYDAVLEKPTKIFFGNTTEKRSYDALGNVTSKTDRNGHVTHYQRNEYGQPILITYPDGTKEKFEYTKSGKLKKQTTPDGREIHFAYDALGRVTRKSYGKNLAEEINTYSGLYLLSKTDKEGHARSYTYDASGKKASESFAGRLTKYSYNSLGHLSEINQNNTLITKQKRDFDGNLLTEEVTTKSGKPLSAISYTYDCDGNQVSATRKIDGKSSTKKTAYDAYGRVVSQIDPLGFTTKTTYIEKDHLKIETTNAQGTKTTKTYDAFSRLVASEIPNVSKTIYAYDKNGNLLTQNDFAYRNGSLVDTQTLKYTYTAKNQVASCTRAAGTPHARTATYTYTPSGKQKTKTLPDGTTLTTTYTPLGYPKRYTSSDGTIDHTYTYTKTGYLLTAGDGKNTITRTLDPHGNVLCEKLPRDITITKSYDFIGRPTKMILDRHGSVEYKYSPLSLQSVTRKTADGEISYTHTYLYSDDGTLISEYTDEGAPTTYTYTLRGETASIASPLLNEEYTYDSLGNLVKRNEKTFSYDALSQITSDDKTTYSHDSLYNSHPVNALSELSSTPETSYTYDLNGNLTQKNETTYKYDALSRLLAVDDITYTYDPLGRKLSRRKGNDVEYYLYDGKEEIGSVTKKHALKTLKVPGLPLKPAAIEIDSKPHTPVTDPFGNVHLFKQPYTTFAPIKLHHNSFSTFTPYKFTKNPYTFATKRLDPDANLLDFGRRHYDPTTHRFLTPDPLFPHDSVNPYQYAYNNPFRYHDPDGAAVGVINFLLFGSAATAAPGAVSIAALSGPIGWFTLAAAVTATAICWKGPQLAEAVNTRINIPEAPRYYTPGDLIDWCTYDKYVNTYHKSKDDKEKDKEGKKSPPYSGKELGTDPYSPEKDGFEWKGTGAPESGKGSWVKGTKPKQETLYPDLDHPAPIKPHWDYVGPTFPDGARLFPDGTWESK